MSRRRSMTAALLLACATALAQEPALPGATPTPIVSATPVASATPAATPPRAFTPVPRSDSFHPVEHQQSQGVAQIAGYLVLLLALFGAGIYILRNGIPTFRMGQKVVRKLNIEETRSLGGRQFLVVAEYEGQRMLLGVCPGRIDHLCVLKTAEPPVFPKIGPELEDAS